MGKPPLPKTGSVDHAIILAGMYHSGQLELDGKTPYICHVMHVMSEMSTDEERIVAALHDIVEDTPMTIYDLTREGFDAQIVDAVDALTKRRGQRYLEEYIPKVAENELATKVKLSDLQHNMDLGRLDRDPTEVDRKRWEKYFAATDLLIRLARERSNKK